MPSKAVGGNGLRQITQQKKSEPLSLTHFPPELKHLLLVLETAHDFSFVLTLEKQIKAPHLFYLLSLEILGREQKEVQAQMSWLLEEGEIKKSEIR